MIETYTIALGNGIDLSCRAAGRRGDPVLVFLHGFPEAAFVWDEMLEHFSDRYRCIAPNLRGYEQSSAPPDVEAYRAKHLVGDVASEESDVSLTAFSSLSRAGVDDAARVLYAWTHKGAS